MDSTILKIAKKLKTYVDETGDFPSSLTVDNVKYNYATFNYLLASSVVNINNKLTNKVYSKAPNITGDSVKVTLNKSEYTTLARSVISFTNSNKRSPNYTSFKSKKIKPQLYGYCFAKILVFHNSNKRYPTSCLFDSSVFKQKTTTKKTNTTLKGKYGHATKTGCDNMGQNTSYYCACHSFQEIVRNLYNIVIPQKTLASVMGTTSSGTGHDGIHTAVAWFNKKYNKKLSMSEKYFSDLGVGGLKKIIASNNQDFIVHLAYQGKYGHYEVVNSIGDSTWNIQNSLGSKCNGGCYCGYKETRSYVTEKAWINAKTGVKSILVFTKE